MRDDGMVRLTLLGVGAMSSPRYRPAGLLVRSRCGCLVIDGGDPTGVPDLLDAWLVCDERAELMPRIRRLAHDRGLEPAVARCSLGEVVVRPLPVEHTSHPTYGYLLESRTRRVGWAPEFWRYPHWAEDLDLLFADAAGRGAAGSSPWCAAPGLRAPGSSNPRWTRCRQGGRVR